ERTIIINNQNPDSKLNKNLTGVGVVYKFIEAYKEELNIDVDVTKYLDLVMLGQTADVSDISDKELRYYIAQGVDKPLNKLLLTRSEERRVGKEGSSRWGLQQWRREAQSRSS